MLGNIKYFNSFTNMTERQEFPSKILKWFFETLFTSFEEAIRLHQVQKFFFKIGWKCMKAN